MRLRPIRPLIRHKREIARHPYASRGKLRHRPPNLQALSQLSWQLQLGQADHQAAWDLVHQTARLYSEPKRLFLAHSP
uniref:Uncharacterized protein n=1 Tax=uncultured marine virus TaxID=186617 RepID=A0A0F7L504_9VIRU|nr:hypothetical protein [uncultured marine virus]